MASGEWLPNVTFEPAARTQLAKLLARHLNDRLAPADHPDAIIRQLEDVATLAPALEAPDLAASVMVIKDRPRAIRTLRRALRPDLAADDMIAGELTFRGPKDAWTFLENLRETLAETESACMAIGARVPKRRGGRPADSRKRWLVQETRRILNEANVPVTRAEDGLLANILRILWRIVLKQEAPIELRPWLSP